MKVVFANIMYELCEKYGADYTEVKDAFVGSGNAVDKYLNVNENLRGFGGVCLPKDTLALANVLSKNNLNFELFYAILKDNQKFKTTVFDGMRE